MEPWRDARPLRMAGDEDGHAAGRPPLPPGTGAPAVGSGSWAPPADSWLARDLPELAGHPDFRLLLEEAAFQALMEGPLFRRPRAVRDGPAQGEASLLCLPFPEKLWRIVSSDEFASIWWDEDGTCVGIDEKLFQKEVLERAGRAKVFQTDSLRSFMRQLNLYGFSKTRQDVRTSVCSTSCLAEGRPVSVVRKLQYYRSPWFKRDCPQLLRRMKRRVGRKAASHQAGGRPAAPALAFPVAEPPGGGAASSEHQQGAWSGLEPHRPAVLAPMRPAPPAALGARLHAAPDLPTTVQNKGTQAPEPFVPVLAQLARPVEFPWLCVTLPPAHVAAYGPLVGPVAGPPQLLSLPPALLPLCAPWVPVVAARPATSPQEVPHPPSPFQGYPGSCGFPGHLPPLAGPPEEDA
uniref:HSF-type DNA-binding domain-containing protein n=1 Tax=Catagonus wagneri TaxID=51154 RepID=A0A8C3YM26_9CETA